MNISVGTRLSRRQLGGLTLAGGAALVAHRGLAAEPSRTSGWIDAHVHVWNPDTTRYPLDAAFEPADMQPPSFTAEQLFRHCKPAGVDRVVLIQMSFYGMDHRYMLEVMGAHPGVFAGVALIDHRAENCVEQMRGLAGRGMRGLRLHSHGDAKEWVDNEQTLKLWKAAGGAGMAICPLINPSDIPYVAELCAKFPETTVVVDHFARVGITGVIEPRELDNLCGLSKFPQAHVKTSAFYALGEKQPPYEDLKPMIRRVLDAFGPERLMWASDCPFQVQAPHSYEASIALIRDRLDFLSEGDKQWMLRGTAEKVFFDPLEKKGEPER